MKVCRWHGVMFEVNWTSAFEKFSAQMHGPLTLFQFLLNNGNN